MVWARAPRPISTTTQAAMAMNRRRKHHLAMTDMKLPFAFVGLRTPLVIWDGLVIGQVFPSRPWPGRWCPRPRSAVVDDRDLPGEFAGFLEVLGAEERQVRPKDGGRRRGD